MAGDLRMSKSLFGSETGGTQGHHLTDWCMSTGGWELEIVKCRSATRGWSQQPKWWIAERTFAWLLRNRRLTMDYERNVQTSETLIEVAMICLLVACLGRLV